MWMHQADNSRQTHAPDNRMHQTVNSRCHNLHNTETQPYQTQKHVLLLVTSRKCTMRMANQKKKTAPVSWHTQHGHHPIPVNHQGTANPTWGDIFESCFKTQSSKLESLFSLKRGKRDLLALSFYVSKMSPEVVYLFSPSYLFKHTSK